jgi:hypothetical protein
VTENRSLDEFVGSDSEDASDDSEVGESVEAEESESVDGEESESVDGEESESGDSADAEPVEASDDPATADNSEELVALDPETVEPVEPTFSATPEERECARCGASVRARWRDEDGYVCGDCKEW